MAFLNETFNTADIPESTGTDPVPAGWYSVSITEANLQTTKAGTGQYIKIRYDITGPTHQGRVVFGNLNIRNANPKAEEIGRQQLGDLMRAIGLQSVSDTDQLIGGHCQVKLAIRKSDEYGDQNEVKSWRAVDGAKPMPAAAPKAASAPSAGAPPWAKK